MHTPHLFAFICVSNAGLFGPNRRRSDNFYTSNLLVESPLLPAKLVGREQYLLSIGFMIYRMHNHQFLPDLAGQAGSEQLDFVDRLRDLRVVIFLNVECGNLANQ